eukprot:GILK01011422.1.p1 GENE.GILK01011422.1~~GILK01011422.1.p1  ORF type:complete len:387 (-),score=60.42 GILK01011422.1:155-1258(-)
MEDTGSNFTVRLRVEFKKDATFICECDTTKSWEHFVTAAKKTAGVDTNMPVKICDTLRKTLDGFETIRPNALLRMRRVAAEVDRLKHTDEVHPHEQATVRTPTTSLDDGRRSVSSRKKADSSVHSSVPIDFQAEDAYNVSGRSLRTLPVRAAQRAMVMMNMLPVVRKPKSKSDASASANKGVHIPAGIKKELTTHTSDSRTADITQKSKRKKKSWSSGRQKKKSKTVHKPSLEHMFIEEIGDDLTNINGFIVQESDTIEELLDTQLPTFAASVTRRSLAAPTAKRPHVQSVKTKAVVATKPESKPRTSPLPALPSPVADVGLPASTPLQTQRPPPRERRPSRYLTNADDEIFDLLPRRKKQKPKKRT